MILKNHTDEKRNIYPQVGDWLTVLRGGFEVKTLWTLEEFTQQELQWCNEELEGTAYFATDAAKSDENFTKIVAYREKLTAWPESADFPNKRPALDKDLNLI